MRSRPRPTLRGFMVLGIGLAATLSVARPVFGQEPPAHSIAVSKTYNHAPFEYQSRLLAQRAAFRVYRLTYPSPVVTPVARNNTVPADYYLPNGIHPGDPQRPAVICLHILDGNEELTDLVCSVLAGRGLPAISFKLPYYGERLGQGPGRIGRQPPTVRRRDFADGRRHSPHHRLARFPAGSRSRGSILRESAWAESSPLRPPEPSPGSTRRA